MTELVLSEMHWRGPYRLYQGDVGGQIDDIDPAWAGVYLWTIPIENRYYPYYAGEASSLHGRLTTHRACLTGGSYWLYDPDELVKGKLTPIYNPNKDYRTFDKVWERAMRFSLLLNFFVLPFPPDEQVNNKRLRLRTELPLARAIGEHFEANPDGFRVWDKTCAPTHERNRRREDEPAVEVTTVVPAGLVGVPSRFSA